MQEDSYRWASLYLKLLYKHYCQSQWSVIRSQLLVLIAHQVKYEGWNFNSGNYLFTTDTK